MIIISFYLYRSFLRRFRHNIPEKFYFFRKYEFVSAGSPFFSSLRWLQRFTVLYKTENTGTAQIIPINPNNDPNTKMENKIRKTFQTNRFSNDLRSDNISVHLLNDDVISTRKITPLNGDARKTSNALGIAPIYGPKNGMILVTPTSTLINAVYGIFAILRAIKVMIATMIELR